MVLSPIRVGPVELTWERPVIMAILNVTPDSFSDGGLHASTDKAVSSAVLYAQQGAQIIDIGGESTRPGSVPVDARTELSRVLPVLKALVAQNLPCAISIDTYKSEVAHACLQEGAHIINDISSLEDPHMASTLAQHKAFAVLMHKKGTPRTMQQGVLAYDDVVSEVASALRASVEKAVDAGVPQNHLWLDPGIGFGKTTDHNLILTTHLRHFVQMGFPVVYGPSRKNFIGDITGQPVDARDVATQTALAYAVAQGAHMLRVHHVAMAQDTVRMACALQKHGSILCLHP